MNPNGDATKIARLEVEVSNLHQIVRALAALPTQLATNTAEQAALSRDVANMRQEWRDDVKHFDEAVEEIARGFELMKKDIQAREVKQRDDRKKDLRWMAVFAVTCAGVVIAALGLLLG